MEQYYLCECGSEYDYPSILIEGDEQVERCPDCLKETEHYSEIKTFVENFK